MTGFFCCIFLLRGKRIQIALQAGHHRPASEMPFQWHNTEYSLGRFCNFSRDPSIAKKPCIFVIFSEGVRTPCPPPPPIRICDFRVTRFWYYLLVGSYRFFPELKILFGHARLGSVRTKGKQARQSSDNRGQKIRLFYHQGPCPTPKTTRRRRWWPKRRSSVRNICDYH